MGIPPLEGGLFENLLIFNYLYGKGKGKGKGTRKEQGKGKRMQTSPMTGGEMTIHLYLSENEHKVVCITTWRWNRPTASHGSIAGP